MADTQGSRTAWYAGRASGNGVEVAVPSCFWEGCHGGLVGHDGEYLSGWMGKLGS